MKLEPEIIIKLQKLGWGYYPFSPNEWQWMKFDILTGLRIAGDGDNTWHRDLEYVRRK